MIREVIEKLKKIKEESNINKVNQKDKRYLYLLHSRGVLCGK